jgi:hypothetical protein
MVAAALHEARSHGEEAVRTVVTTLLDRQRSGKEFEKGDILDVLLSLRNQSAWPSIVRISKKFPHLFIDLEAAQLKSVALNRAGLSCQAEQSLFGLIARYGPNSETLGILGRVYKDRFAHAREAAQKARWLLSAIKAYAAGAKRNPGEVYPLINLMTLMACSGNECSGSAASHLMRLLHERFQSGGADYFDFATGLEAAIILGCWDIAREFLKLTISIPSEGWELETTVNNLVLLASTAPAHAKHAILSLVELFRTQVPTARVDIPQRWCEPRPSVLARSWVFEMSHAQQVGKAREFRTFENVISR